MIGLLSLLTILSWKQDIVGGIRLLELRVPAHAAEGGSALLGCQFDMEGDDLYSVKWYKNGREFYRYVPNNRIPTYHFPTSGVVVDVSRSSSTVVALTNLRQESAGLYRCEVSGEAPKFATAYDEKYITIHYLPKTSPTIEGLQTHYDIGDRLALNCSSAGSHPEAQLKWLVNDRVAAREHLRGPWYRISRERPSAMETILELRFTVMPRHFKKGVLSIKCQAIIAPLYEDEVVHHILWDDNAYSTMAAPFEHADTQSIPSPVYNEIKHLGFPPLDEFSAQETDNDSTNNTSRYEANFAQLLVIVVLFKYIL